MPFCDEATQDAGLVHVITHFLHCDECDPTIFSDATRTQTIMASLEVREAWLSTEV